MRLVTFNALHGGIALFPRGDERLDERLALTIEGLRRTNPDVVALQESSAGPRRGDVAARIAAALGLHRVRAPAGYRWIGPAAAWVVGFDEGPAILSRFPIVESQAVDLDACGEWYRRVLLCAVLDAPGGRVDVCSTHASGTICQLRSLAEAVRSRPRDRPLVLMGDLNATPDSDGVRNLVDKLGLVDTFRRANPNDPGFTVWQPVRSAARSARRRVDYVMVAAPAGARIRESRLVLDAPGHAADGRPLWPSDHYGVLSDIELLPTP